MEPRIWSTSELAALKGWGPAQVRSAVREGRITRVRRGSFIEAPAPRPGAAHIARVRAAAHALGEGTVVSHISAAVLLGLPVPQSLLSSVWVTRPHSNGERTPTLRAFRAPVADDERTVVQGVPVTSLARTVVDLARTVPFEWGVAAADATLRQGVQPVALEQALDRARRRPGMRRARRVVAFADERAGSPGESLSRAHFLLQGVPAPVLQRVVRTASGIVVGLGDFGWEDERVIGEFDGALKYDGGLGRPEDVIMAEKRREQAFRDEGWWLVRWGWSELLRPAELAERVRRALDHGRRQTS